MVGGMGELGGAVLLAGDGGYQRLHTNDFLHGKLDGVCFWVPRPTSTFKSVGLKNGPGRGNWSFTGSSTPYGTTAPHSPIHALAASSGSWEGVFPSPVLPMWDTFLTTSAATRANALRATVSDFVLKLEFVSSVTAPQCVLL